MELAALFWNFDSKIWNFQNSSCAHASELASKSFVSELIAEGLEIELREATPVVRYHYAHLKHVFRYGGAGSKS